MKLNKNGWSTTEMLVLSGGLLLALIVSIYFIVKLYGSFGAAIGNKEYVDLEIKLENAARDYIVNNDIGITGEFRVSYETLKEAGYITNFKDSKGQDCAGYVIVTSVNSINNYAGYITCQDYETRNY